MHCEKLMIHYIVMEARKIAESEESLRLVKENGEFASDLMSSLLRNE